MRHELCGSFKLTYLEHFSLVIRCGIERNKIRNFCTMQTAQEFLLWYLDKSRTEINFAETEEHLLSLPKTEQDSLRKALELRQAEVRLGIEI